MPPASSLVAPGIAKLFDQTLAADTLSIDTGSIIPPTYVALLAQFYGQSNEAGTPFGQVQINVNGDTGANYEEEQLFDSGGSAGGQFNAAQTKWVAAIHSAGGGSSSYASPLIIEMPGYANTTFWKSFIGRYLRPDATAGNSGLVMQGYGWRSTAAVSRIAFSANTGQLLKAGSRLVVYGLI